MGSGAAARQKAPPPDHRPPSPRCPCRRKPLACMADCGLLRAGGRLGRDPEPAVAGGPRCHPTAGASLLAWRPGRGPSTALVDGGVFADNPCPEGPRTDRRHLQPLASAAYRGALSRQQTADGWLPGGRLSGADQPCRRQGLWPGRDACGAAADGWDGANGGRVPTPHRGSRC